MKKINFKISPKKIIFYIYIVIGMISIGSLAVSSLFLYKNFYQTTLDSAELLTLQQKVAIEMVNIKKFNDVITQIDQKISSSSIQISTNPFE